MKKLTLASLCVLCLSLTVLARDPVPSPTPAASPSPSPSAAAAAKSEDFSSKSWKTVADSGQWVVGSSPTIIEQRDPEKVKGHAGNTNYYRPVDQSGTMEYQFTLTMKDGKNGCGVFFFAESGDKGERENSYLVWVRPSDNTISILKTTSNAAPKPVTKDAKDCLFKDAKIVEGQPIKVKVVYNSDKGEFSVSVNDKPAGKCVDMDPLTKGGFVSLTTCCTQAQFKDMTIASIAKAK